ncbi:hypothetical protein STCU_07611 [Strigomonas culicis]|uniref:Fungal lipase-type domain-containing protein n=1 Tax=Strigomonas culicis TaxID=28005 RepID=S9U4D4_9TRYP|nr:hypothetical protein STCU_07611 [Strigomonas culicis]|eukprot:EPY23629.1 hypothetical protein STCU_07611 [Strigomonas culicis]
MRYIGFWLAVVFGVFFTLWRSFAFGFGATITMLLYLNFPHLLGYTTLTIADAVLRCRRSYAWLFRHPDALAPFLFLSRRTRRLCSTLFYYFRHHSPMLLLLLCVNVLLLARTIDLVRAFDTTSHGCVRWSDARTNRRLWPSLAMLLEDAYELQYTGVEEVGLDLAFDISKMELTHGDQVVQLRRTQVIPYGAARFYLHSRHFYAYTVPRVLTFQTSASVGNHQVRVAKVVLRAITLTALLIFAGIACGMVVQAAFPQLRPLPVRVTVSDDLSRLSVDHLVSHLHIHTTQQPAAADERAQLGAKWDPRLEALRRRGRDLYPRLCEMEHHGTTTLELSLLSLAAYLFNADEVRSLLTFMNAHFDSDWELRARHGDRCVAGDSNHEPTSWQGFIELSSRRRDVSVVAVRGTDMSSFTDFLIDVNLFMEMTLYQVLARVIPGVVLIPHELVGNTLRILSMPPEEDRVPWAAGARETWQDLAASGNHSLRACQQNNYRRDFYVDAYNHLAYVGSRRHFREPGAGAREDWRPSHVVLTGHSLGGAVAAILAAQLDVPAVVFSAPGIALLRHRFGLALHKVHRNVVSVISSDDIVPFIGTNGGEVHHMQCMAARKDLCHAVEFTIGALWRSCDSLQERFPDIDDFY